jgi:hypothetical protein
MTQRLSRRPLRRLPRATDPGRASVRRQQVLEAAREEHFPPAVAIVASQLKVEVVPCHAGDVVADPAPRIQPSVED